MHRQGSTLRMLTALLAAGWLLAAGASAETRNGAGEVRDTNLQERTIQLDSGLVLHVRDKTVIEGPDGERLGLVEVPKAVYMPEDDGWRWKGDEAIEFEARQLGQRWVADRVKVLGVAVR